MVPVTESIQSWCCRPRDRRQATVHRTVAFGWVRSRLSFDTKEKAPLWGAFSLVPVTGIEPVRFLRRGILSPLCLPVPPHRRLLYSSTFLLLRQESGISNCCLPARGDALLPLAGIAGSRVSASAQAPHRPLTADPDSGRRGQGNAPETSPVPAYWLPSWPPTSAGQRYRTPYCRLSAPPDI